MASAHILFAGALVLSAILMRRMPFLAVALTLAGAGFVAFAADLRQSVILILLAGTAGIEICYIAGTRPRRQSLAAAALVGAGMLALWFAPPDHAGYPHETAVVAVVLMMVIAWLIGNSIRQTHRHSEILRQRAAAEAVTAERLRIARELHDMVAHSIGIIAIQAGAGRRVIDARPDEAKNALAAIEATSRETLSGLRRMLTGLRRSEASPGQPPRDPSPGLADIERLAALTLDAGVGIDLHWAGRRAPLPADIDLSAYRIIQEAVTNVVRHAGTARCRVTIDQQDDQLAIEVVDDGRGGLPAGTGYGILGMRERAALLAGEFSAGPRPGGGFRVAARLPVPAVACGPACLPVMPGEPVPAGPGPGAPPAAAGPPASALAR
jgi:signal transduction histidine kinase